jgi:hypothetical protein
LGAIETTQVAIFERVENINLWHKHLGWHLGVENIKNLVLKKNLVETFYPIVSNLK